VESIKFLIVEDSPQTQETLRSLLGAQESEMTIVSTGEEAFVKLEAGLKPNLIILDINLPGMDGAEVLSKLRMDDRWKKIPVVPFSSLWNETLDEPFQKDLKMVKDWMSASRLNEKVEGGYISAITPKFRGQEDTNVVHPRLIVSVARILIQQNEELSPAFQHLLYISKKQLEETVR